MFSYETATNLELVAHVGSMTSAAISVARKYHEVKKNFEIVGKIDAARNYIKLQKLKQQVVVLQDALILFEVLQ